jgi:hypothetical protein
MTTATCRLCATRYDVGRRSNQYKLARGEHHSRSKYCSPKCRVAAHRKRRKSAPVTVARTTLAASVTSLSEPIDKYSEFSLPKTMERPLSEGKDDRPAVRLGAQWRITWDDDDFWIVQSLGADGWQARCLCKDWASVKAIIAELGLPQMKTALVGKHDPPINIIGGYKFHRPSRRVF